MWYRIWYRIKKKSRKNSPSTIELISLDIYISSFNFTLLRIEGNNLQNYSTYSPTYSLSSDRINSLLLFPKRVARFLSKLATFLFENNSVQIVLSYLRQALLSIDIRFGIILFFAIPITANDFSNSTVVAPGSLKITYFPRLSWSSLEFPRIEEPIRFSSSHSTLPLDPLHPLKTERNGEWPFSGKVSKLRPDIAFNLGYWNCEISINSFELREREREKDSKYIWKNRIPFIREDNGWINIDLIYRIIQRVFVCNTKSKWSWVDKNSTRSSLKISNKKICCIKFHSQNFS